MAIEYTLGFGGSIPDEVPVTISHEDFLAFGKHRNVVRHAISLEEKYDIVLAGYVDLEKTLLTYSIEHMLMSHASSVWMSASRRRINQYFLSFLSLSKTYFDHAKRHVAGIFGRNSAEFVAYKVLVDEANQKFSSRVMSKIRGHAQHFDFPVHEVWYGASWLDGKKGAEESVLAHSISMFLTLKEAEKDREFSTLLPEIDARGGRVDLRKCSAEYVDSLSNLHFATRSLFAPHTNLALKECSAAIAKFRAAGPQNHQYVVYAHAFDTADQTMESIPMPERSFEYFEELQQLHDQATNITKTVAASRVPER